MTTTNPTKPNHALDNCKGQLEKIIELYKLSDAASDASLDCALERSIDDPERDIEEEARGMALDACWKSDYWEAVGAELIPTKGRVLLSWGGPACQVVCDLDGDVASNPEIQWQDWSTPWRTPSIQYELELDFDIATAALEWFITLFYWGE
tara:strand:- start:186 stop:638 length:453 start_codon:yes stop_codon:yes gene_type:complete